MRESEGIDAERGRVYVTKREIESERERERESRTEGGPLGVIV